MNFSKTEKDLEGNEGKKSHFHYVSHIRSPLEDFSESHEKGVVIRENHAWAEFCTRNSEHNFVEGVVSVIQQWGPFLRTNHVSTIRFHVPPTSGAHLLWRHLDPR